MSSIEQISMTNLNPKFYEYLVSKTIKINDCDIFEIIRSSMGIIADNNGKVIKSGFFISLHGRALFVTTKDDLPAEINQIRVHTQYDTFEIGTPQDIVASKVNETHLQIFECYGKINFSYPNKFSFLEIAPKDINLKEGTKVYFSGMPLTLKKLAFHKGIISSNFSEEAIRYFMIDGTIVRGMSGGPVVMQSGGKVYVVGIIKSQIVDPINIEKVEYNESHPEEIKVLSMKVEDIYEDVINNRSTGVGKAIDVRHCYEMFSEISDDYNLPFKDISSITEEELAGKSKKRGGRPAYGSSIQINGQEHQFWEWRPKNCKGGGRRGLTISMPQLRQKITYVFDVNPHYISAYRDHEHQLYDAAAAAFKSSFESNNETNLPFSFQYYSITFNATLEETENYS